MPGREPRRPSSREPVQVRPGNRAQTGLVRDQRDATPGRRHATSATRAPPAPRTSATPRAPPAPRTSATALSLDAAVSAARHADAARRTRATRSTPNNTENAHLIDQDLIDTVLNDSDGSPHLTRPHPRRRRRAARRLAHDGLQRLQPARSAQPHAARAGAQRRARPGLHGPRPGGPLAAPRQGRIARARLRPSAALHLRRPRGGALPLRRRRRLRGAGHRRWRSSRSCRRAPRSSCARRSSTATSCSALPRTTSAWRRSAPAGCPTSSSTSRPTSTARA